MPVTKYILRHYPLYYCDLSRAPHVTIGIIGPRMQTLSRRSNYFPIKMRFNYIIVLISRIFGSKVTSARIESIKEQFLVGDISRKRARVKYLSVTKNIL